MNLRSGRRNFFNEEGQRVFLDFEKYQILKRAKGFLKTLRRFRFLRKPFQKCWCLLYVEKKVYSPLFEKKDIRVFPIKF